MIIIISGSTHSGKTLTAKRLIKKLSFFSLSEDLLKMGLINSGLISADQTENEKLKMLIWNVTKEIIKVAIENKEDLIIEGVYVPDDISPYFTESEAKEIKRINLILSRSYIENNFDKILKHEDIVEKRLVKFDVNKAEIIKDNEALLASSKKFNIPYYAITSSLFYEKNSSDDLIQILQK